MVFIQSFLFVIAIIVAVLFTLLVFVTGKGDAMAGGSSVRTTFKGKASFEDMISRVTFYLGIAFMILVLTLDIFNNRVMNQKKSLTSAPAASKSSEQKPPPPTKP